ncbi:MAG: hypothetical protein WCP28_03760 [Actinomycetes bacterium]
MTDQGPAAESGRTPAPFRIYGLSSALISFAVLRVINVVWVLLVMDTASKKAPNTFVFGDWEWYLSIAVNGYLELNPGHEADHYTDLAFFPLLPFLTRIVMVALGIAPFLAAVLVSSVACVLAAWALYRIGEVLDGPKTGFYLALAWAVVPPASLALNLPLSESLFTACAAWALLMLLRGQLVGAALLCVLAGLTRPTAAAVIASVFWVALGNLWRHRDVLVSLVSMLIAPLGLIGVVLFVGSQTGSLTGYLQVQKAWNAGVDFGARWFNELAGRTDSSPDSASLWLALLLFGCSLVLLGWFLRARPPAALTVYTVGCLFLMFGMGGPPSQIQRWVIPVFPLLIPIASALARIRLPVAAALLGLALVATSVNSVFFVDHFPYAWQVTTDASHVEGDRSVSNCVVERNAPLRHVDQQ